MNLTVSKLFVAAIAALIFAASAIPASAAPEARLSDLVIDSIRAQAQAEGIDADAILAGMAEVMIHHPDGTVEMRSMPFGESIMHIAGDTLVQPAAKGPAGTPEIVAGDFIHIAYTVSSGASWVYDVQASETVPSTEPVTLPEVALPEPLMPMSAYDVGGPMYNVKGSYQTGMHTAGSTYPAVSTSEDGPFLPQKDGFVVIPDNSIDFVGHASIQQARFCFWGLCVSYGVMVAGAGVAQFDETPTEPVPSTAFPRLP